MKVSNKCCICGTTNLKPAHLPSSCYRLEHCMHCDHFQIEIGSKPEDNVEIQLKYFDKNFATRKGCFISYYEGINSRRAVRLLNLERSSKILEVGPGRGLVMQRFSELGHNVTGLDLSPEVAQHIKSCYGLTVVTSSPAEHVESGRNVYGAVIMRHVLEHFSDPLNNMKVVYDLLHEGGKLYLAVPNIDSWHRMWRGWSGYEPYHIQYFSRKSIVKCLELSGFKNIQVGSYESQSGWVNTLTKSVEPLVIGDVNTNERSKTGKLRIVMEYVRLFVGLVISPLRWFQSSVGRGEELYVVATRSSE